MQSERNETKTRQVYSWIRDRIMQGIYKAGTSLPSTRELAKELGVSRALIVEVYEQLTAEGFLEGKQGSGTFVRDIGSSTTLRLQPEDRSYRNEDISPMHGDRSSYIDFRPSFPALEHVPLQKWKRVALDVYHNFPPSMLGYQEDMAGDMELRQAICDHLLHIKGLHCLPSQIIVTAGATQAFSILGKLLLTAGETIAMEDPTATFIHNIFAETSARIVPVPVDSDGLCVEQLPTDVKPKCIFVTPSHQFPFGSILSISRRLQLLDYARNAGAYIIEDDYDSEFRYGGMPIHALRELDTERVIYVGTFSKNMFPALRLGYIVAPQELVESIVQLKRTADMQSPVLSQSTLARFMNEGHLKRHILRMKRIYHKRRTHLLQALRETFGENVQISGDAAGLHLIATWPGRSADLLTAMELEKHHIKIYPAERYTIRKDQHNDSLIMGFGNVNETQISEGIQVLAQFI
ncbi:PLP-dependent aminotransferase family protein [Paenibacillus amylolyticus]|uniref:PLP-dependent aminotransferase family protein n=1 Tax=Paenibacillus amylolyticus TaxID=1451 RepID=A0A5M9WZX0_PAEAM|nr:PLP-dependent aminotransferase family protein [Paenibacillus amylolyticus]KAA8787227.1 PLP-dependent aminotransferase family protein [Paenibacillus amylolyticus]